jgi:hypothetical protein
MRLWLAALLALAFASQVRADAPVYLPVEGELSDARGEPVDGVVELRLRLYDRPDAGEAEHIYEEQLAQVRLREGHFSVYLGLQKPLDATTFRAAGELFLGVRVVGDGAELLPRVALGSTAYVAHARQCGDAQTLEGKRAEDFVASSYAPDFSSITGRPEQFPADAHRHDARDLTGVPPGLIDGDDDTGLTLLTSGPAILVDSAGRTAKLSLDFGACPPGSALSSVTPLGTTSCEPDDVAPLDADRVDSGELGKARYSAVRDLDSEGLLSDADTALLTRAAADSRYPSLGQCGWLGENCTGLAQNVCTVDCSKLPGTVMVSGGCDLLATASNPGIMIRSQPILSGALPESPIGFGQLTGWRCETNITGKLNAAYALCCTP